MGNFGSGLGSEVSAPGAHAVRTLDWMEPTLGEAVGPRDPSRVNARHSEARTRRLEAESRARAVLGSDAKGLRQFERLLAVAQRYAEIREELVGEWTLPWPILRRAVVRLGTDLVARDAMNRPEDVWFLRRDEVVAALDGAFVLSAAEAADRRRTWDRQRRLVPPLLLGTVPPMIKGLVESAEAAIRGTAIPSSAAGAAIVGIPASGGRASGPVRLVHSVEEFDLVRAGDVLVAPMTAPAWTPLFDRVVAIVTDTGGVAAHASIVAREYGLPAVVGTGDATRRLRDGEIVEVDGSAGLVRRLDSV